jgi:hypothetical protein
VRAQSLNSGSSFEPVTVWLEDGMVASVCSPPISLSHSQRLWSDLQEERLKKKLASHSCRWHCVFSIEEVFIMLCILRGAPWCWKQAQDHFSSRATSHKFVVGSMRPWAATATQIGSNRAAAAQPARGFRPLTFKLAMRYAHLALFHTVPMVSSFHAINHTCVHKSADSGE